jgi:hypothetical protein
METTVQIPGKKHPPECKYLVFSFNPETKYYQMTTGEMGFYKVPNELKLEITQRPEIIKSGVIIQSRIVNGKRQFFTGLLKTRFDSWYFGDHFEVRHGIKKNSFILFHFREDQAVFEMFFFNLIKIYPDHRERFISDFLNSLKKINGAENSHPV